MTDRQLDKGRKLEDMPYADSYRTGRQLEKRLTAAGQVDSCRTGRQLENRLTAGEQVNSYKPGRKLQYRTGRCL